jgi:hypothetical protein
VQRHQGDPGGALGSATRATPAVRSGLSRRR